jgi:phosphatidylglycerophosphatase C
LTSRILAVFDFDHTITPWDTAARFFFWLMWRRPWKAGFALIALPFLGPLLAFRHTRKVPIRFGAWVATLGVSHAQLPDLARMHIREVTERGEKFVRSDARARLNDHLAQGHEVVVATGCLEVLAREILMIEGLGTVAVVGSSVRRYFGGMVVLEHCFGERKIPMLAARGFVAPWDFAYSDHRADLPLLLRGKQQYLVNPLPKCASVLSPALGKTATLVSWN